MAGWKMSFLLGRPIFRGYVSFREGTKFFLNEIAMGHFHWEIHHFHLWKDLPLTSTDANEVLSTTFQVRGEGWVFHCKHTTSKATSNIVYIRWYAKNQSILKVVQQQRSNWSSWWDVNRDVALSHVALGCKLPPNWNFHVWCLVHVCLVL